MRDAVLGVRFGGVGMDGLEGWNGRSGGVGGQRQV